MEEKGDEYLKKLKLYFNFQVSSAPAGWVSGTGWSTTRRWRSTSAATSSSSSRPGPRCWPTTPSSSTTGPTSSAGSASEWPSAPPSWYQCYKTFFPSLQTMRPNKLECLYLAITFKSSLTFAGNTRSLPKKEASERTSNWVCSGLAVKFKDLTGKGVSLIKRFSFIVVTDEEAK